MAESYEKRSRAKRKQMDRSRKLERKRNRDPEAPKEEVSGDEYLQTPEDIAQLKQEAEAEAAKAEAAEARRIAARKNAANKDSGSK
jgi:hypothetical protein